MNSGSFSFELQYHLRKVARILGVDLRIPGENSRILGAVPMITIAHPPYYAGFEHGCVHVLAMSAPARTPCRAELATSRPHPQDLWNSQVVAEDSEPSTV